jgi:hypothetical protein
MGLPIDWEVLLARVTPTPPVTWQSDDGMVGTPIVAVVMDMTALVASMARSSSVTSFQQGRQFVVQVRDKIRYGWAGHAGPKVLCWDKQYVSPYRRKFHAESRHKLNTEPSAKHPHQGANGYFYASKEDAPLQPHEIVITDAHISNINQLIAHSQTKIALNAYLCERLYHEFNAEGQQHVIFDTPYLVDNDFCDGGLHCTGRKDVPGARLCAECSELLQALPKCAESELQLFFYIEHFYHKYIKVPLPLAGAQILVLNTDDNDLLVVLSSCRYPAIADHITWKRADCWLTKDIQDTFVRIPASKGARKNAAPARGSCRGGEYVQMGLMRTLFSQQAPAVFWSQCMALFLMGGDYCARPDGFVIKHTFTGLLAMTTPFLFYEAGLATSRLILHIEPYVDFLRAVLALQLAPKRAKALTIATLVASTFDAFYSVAYYTGCFTWQPAYGYTGPDVTLFGHTLAADGTLRDGTKRQIKYMTDRIAAALAPAEPVFDDQVVYEWEHSERRSHFL